jgi:hypothetical protein
VGRIVNYGYQTFTLSNGSCNYTDITIDQREYRQKTAQIPCSSGDGYGAKTICKTTGAYLARRVVGEAYLKIVSESINGVTEEKVFYYAGSSPCSAAVDSYLWFTINREGRDIQTEASCTREYKLIENISNTPTNFNGTWCFWAIAKDKY